MKTTKSKFTIVLAGLILLGSAIAPSQVAVAQFANLNPFQVPEGRTNVPLEHNNAVYMVFQSKPPPHQKYGIFFVQTLGTYPFVPFLCTDEEWQPGSKTVSCFVDRELPAHSLQLRETITVGKLTSDFCDFLRGKFNPPEGEDILDPIMQDSECHAPGRCTCYEVVHECRENQGDEWDEDKCPEDLRRIFADQPSKGDERDPSTGDIPPSRGAGSGSN
jgi:hypothetical protein